MKYEPVYIYALIDPRDDVIRYIGKSIDPDYRYVQHMNEKVSNKGKIAWIAGLELEDLQPEMKVLEIANEKNWEEREKWWIERGREFGWPLLNISPGGEAGRLYQPPSCFYWLLEKDLLDRFEAMPNKEQADIVLEIAMSMTEIFKNKIKAHIEGDTDKYYELENIGREIVISGVSSLCDKHGY